MGERLPVPVDFTGIPLVVAPNSDLATERRQRFMPTLRDQHHTFYPRRVLMRLGDDGNQVSGSEYPIDLEPDCATAPELRTLHDDALDELWSSLRGSREQELFRDEHDLYHATFGTPELPQTEFDLIRTLVLCAAGYMPAWGVSLYPGRNPERVPLSPAERAKLAGRHGVHVEHLGRIRRVLIDYVVRHGIDQGELEVEEFLETEDMERKAQIGRTLIERASMEATVPLQYVYARAHERRRLPAGKPPHVGQYVVDLLVNGYKGVMDGQTVSWLAGSLKLDPQP